VISPLEALFALTVVLGVAVVLILVALSQRTPVSHPEDLQDTGAIPMTRWLAAEREQQLDEPTELLSRDNRFNGGT
jgi:hypothetical protein